jgi:5-methylcytosine-specific restriction endonuclease McrA
VAIDGLSGLTHEALRARDGDLCYYCRRVMSFEKAKPGAMPPDKASLDHVTPLSRGGGHTFENTVLACLQCNFEKNAKTPEEWLAPS